MDEAGRLEARVVDPSSVPARRALTEYFTELAARFPEGFDVAGALDDAAARFLPPEATFLLAVRDGETVGCGALERLDDDTVELRRMWVSPGARRQGVGTFLMKVLENEAVEMGCTSVVLDTHGSLREAIAMYHRHGYHEIADYNGNPNAQHWFAKRLSSRAGR